MENNEIKKVSEGELVTANNEISEKRNDLVDYSVSTAYRFVLIGIVSLYLVSLFLPVLSSSVLFFFERNSSILGSLLANFSFGNYVAFTIIFVFCFVIPAFLILSLTSAVFKSSSVGFYLVMKAQKLKVPVYSLFILVLITVLQIATTKSSLGIGWYLFFISYLGMIAFNYKLSNEHFKPLQNEGAARLNNLLDKMTSILVNVVILVGIILVLVIVLKVYNSDSFSNSSVSPLLTEPSSNSRSAQSDCYSRGVAYYKEIGSFPTLSNGVDVKTKVIGMCERSNGAAFSK
ncbi:hypothetical protein [Thiomicrorhabdus indica]|uniref:hypothetical protein n=1 Tax=Thiomicrorhabdus indica TaxID=2267253 RepID=UPI002AA94916|nr:hypothetical protein [Thiomicrorhabdus indica]